MGKKFAGFDSSSERLSAWSNLCRPGEYLVTAPSALPTSAFPAGLLAKVDNAVIMASASPDGIVVYGVNLHRVDRPASAVDQESFMFGFRDGVPFSGGVMAHHGTWTGRTVKPPQDFWDAITVAGIGKCQPLPGLPEKLRGPLTELEGSSQRGAWPKLVTKMKRFFSGSM